MVGPVAKDAAIQTIELIDSDALRTEERAAIIALCTAAFAEDFANLFALLPGSRHLLLHIDGIVLAHACWVTRWLHPAGHAPLRTAYIEAVAVHPGHQRRGLGSVLMRRIAEEIAGYDLGGLSPASRGFYERLGWEMWRGPLAIRHGAELLPTPDEGLLILRTRHTPPLDLDAAISAEWREGELW